MHVLKVKILDNCPNREFVEEYYLKANTLSYKKDCGVDIIFPAEEHIPVGDVVKCYMGIACEFLPNGGNESGAFDLVPRSSIVNTPLTLANSIGIFDPGYRGEVIVALRCHVDRNHTMNDSIYTVSQGQRLVQIVAPDRKPIRVEVVDTLSEADRGENGFGSTNNRSTS